MPDFLQLKQNPRINNFKQAFFGDRRKTLKTLAFLVLLLAIPLTVWLVQVTQIFSPRAAGAPIELVSGGDCVLSANPNKVDCATFPIRLTSPLGPIWEEASPSPSFTPSPIPSPSAVVSPNPSASAAVSPSPSASPAQSPSPSPSLSPSPANVASCVSTKLGITAPVATTNYNNQTILYWRSPVSIAQLTSAANECDAKLLDPYNFSTPVLEAFIRANSGGTTRSVWVQGPCSDQKVNEYRNAGIRVSADVQCSPPDTELDYKVFPTPNQFDGIGDFGLTGGDPAVVIPTQSSSSFWPQLFLGLINKFIPQAGAQTDFNNSVATCVSSGLGLGNPAIAVNTTVSNTTLVFWNQSVNRTSFLQKASECGAEILKPNNFTADDVRNLVQSVTGAPSNSSDTTKYRQIIVEGPCSVQKLGEYQNFTILADSQCAPPDTELDFKVNQSIGGVMYNGIADGGASGYPMIIVSNTAVSPTPTGNPSSSPSGSPSSAPSADPSSRTLKYRLAETEAGLATAEFKDYTSHPLITDFTFSDSTPGMKQIWVEFVSTSNESRIEHINVELVGDRPEITSLDCSMDISGQSLKLTVSGKNLGASGGKVTANAKDAQINSWNENQIAATIQPDGNLEQGRQFKVAVTTSEDELLPEVICEVNTSLISLGARLFCRAPGKFDVNGVKVLLVDENGGKAEEEVTIDTNGLIKGLKTRLQVGRPYVLSIKAEHSLRKNLDFVAANGTNVVKPANDDSLILPVGDIAPVILPDGKINVPDRAELVRQWSVLGGSTQTGDFNRDGRVNSIDWACMRFDFNREDEAIPTRAQSLPTGSSSPAPTNTSIPSSSASTSPVVSPSPSMSPLPSGQRAGFFLLNPLEGGTYINGDEFIVDLNIWSQIEAANLFVAKLTFDETALEVVRIEKGTELTTWAEEFFDNQTGQISLVAGKPSPGLKTTPGVDVRMARIIFRSKKVGTIELSVTNESRIFSNADNANILTSLLSTQIEIVNQ